MEKIELKHDEEKGEILAEDNSVLMLSRGNLAHLQREFEKVMGPAASLIMYKSGSKYAQNVESNIKRGIIKLWAKLSMESVAKRMLKQFSGWGYGHAEILELNKATLYTRLRVTNSANALGYEKSKKPVCHFVRGIFAGAATILMDRKMGCLETKCVAKGDPYCEFEVITPENWKKGVWGKNRY